MLACADGNRARALDAAADVVYHLLVALRAVGGIWDEVLLELEARRT